LFVRGDIADPGAVRSLFKKHDPTAFFNFAAETHVDRSIDDPGSFVHSNLLGVFELLEAARLHLKSNPRKAKDFRFLHVSTDEVYGTLGKSGAFSEKTNYAPNSPYAATKAGADHLVRAFHKTYNLPLLLTNCSNNYGPYQFPEKLIPLMILNALEGKSLPIYGDGGNVRDWLYVRDHCEALWLVAQKGKPGEKYNVGGGGERTNLQVVDRLCALLDKMAPASQNPALAGRGITRYGGLRAFVRDRPGHDRRYAIDAGKIRRELGWKPRHTFEKGLEETVGWYLSHLDWCAAAQKGKYHRERLG